MPAHGCKCVRPLQMAEDPGHCFRCGHGPFKTGKWGKPPRRRRLPQDLGALQREGRRPDPNLENVVRFERLRSRVLVLLPEPEPEPVPVTPDDLSPRQRQVLGLLAAGLRLREVAAALGLTLGSVYKYASGAYRVIGVDDAGHGESRRLAVVWWHEHSSDVRVAA